MWARIIQPAYCVQFIVLFTLTWSDFNAHLQYIYEMSFCVAPILQYPWFSASGTQVKKKSFLNYLWPNCTDLRLQALQHINVRMILIQQLFKSSVFHKINRKHHSRYLHVIHIIFKVYLLDGLNWQHILPSNWRKKH